MFELLEHQFAPKKVTRESIIKRLISAGGEVRRIDGEDRIYVYRIAWYISGYNPDTHVLVGKHLEPKEVREWEEATLPIYFSTKSFTFIYPAAGETCALLVDDTLKITADLKDMEPDDHP